MYQTVFVVMKRTAYMGTRDSKKAHDQIVTCIDTRDDIVASGSLDKKFKVIHERYQIVLA